MVGGVQGWVGVRGVGVVGVAGVAGVGVCVCVWVLSGVMGLSSPTRYVEYISIW